MILEQAKIINSWRMFLDELCIAAAGCAAAYLKYFHSGKPWQYDNKILILSVLVIMITGNFFLRKYSLYSEIRDRPTKKEFLAILKSISISFGILAACIFLFQEKRYSREFFLGFYLLTIGLLFALRMYSRLFMEHFYKNNFGLRKILIVGCIDRGKIVSDLLSHQLSWGHEIVGFLNVGGCSIQKTSMKLGEIEDLPEILKNMTIDEVVFAISRNRTLDLIPYLAYCKKVGVTARILPALWQPETADLLKIENCQGVPFFSISAYKSNATGMIYKRALDILGGTVGLLIFLFLYPFIAVAIKLESKGPVLFKQKRVGMNGRCFILYKFRSMCINAEAMKKNLMLKNEIEGAFFKLKRDPRITKVGAWLRKTSLDEIPQFINVLKGQMSLVGTRPPTIDEVEQYDVEHYKRISSKPGITGLWQISGRSQIKNFDDIVKLDINYIENWRFIDDLKILWVTIFTVFQRKGAY